MNDNATEAPDVGASDKEKDIDYTTTTPIEINVALLNINEETKYLTIKLMEMYGSMIDSLKEILTENSNNEPYRTIISTFGCAKMFEKTDMDLHDALIATALFEIYKHLYEDDDYDQFMVNTLDAKGIPKVKMDYDILSKYLIRKYAIISFGGIPYVYINDQYYADGRLEKLIKEILKIFKHTEVSKHIKIKDLVKDIIFRIVGTEQKIVESPFNRLSNKLIPCKNGIVHRETMILLPNSPAFGMLYRLNAVFDPNVKTNEMGKYLDSLVEVPEDAELLLQIPAQALIQNPQHQLAYTLTGDGKNGKSTYIIFLQNFVGRFNYTSISLQDLTENRFARAELDGKLLNAYPDLNKNAVKYTGIFKALTGSDTIQCERKYGQPFQLTNKAVFCFSANELPEISDATYAFWRRLCVIPFPNRFESDPYLIERLCSQDNMSAFLNLVINKMNRIDLQGLSKSDRIEKANQLWKARSSSAYAFVTDCIQKDVNGKISKPTMENLYRAYCEDKDITTQSFVNVVNELQKLHVIISRTRDESSHMISVYRGIKYVKPDSSVKYFEDVVEEVDDEELLTIVEEKP